MERDILDLYNLSAAALTISTAVYVWWYIYELRYRRFIARVQREMHDAPHHLLEDVYFHQHVRMYKQLTIIGVVGMGAAAIGLPDVAWTPFAHFTAPCLIAALGLRSVNSSHARHEAQTHAWSTVAQRAIHNVYSEVIAYAVGVMLAYSLLSQLISDPITVLYAIGGCLYAMYITWLHSPRMLTQRTPHQLPDMSPSSEPTSE